MKKFSRILVCMLLVVSVILAIAGCSQKDDAGLTILKAPKKLAISDDTLTWKANKKATKYGIKLGENSEEIFYTEDTFFTIATSDAGGSYDVYVQSVGDGEKYADSEFAGPLNFKKPNQLEVPVNLTIDKAQKLLSWDSVTGADSYIVDIANITSDTSETVTVNEAKYSLAGLPAAAAEYSIKVTAVSADNAYYTSIPSSRIAYVITEQLSTPDNFQVRENTTSNYIEWDTVENASSYRIRAEKTGGNTVYTYDTSSGTLASTSLSNLKIVEAGEYKVTIQARNTTSAIFTDSEISQSITIIKLAAVENFRLDQNISLANPSLNYAKLTWDSYTSQHAVQFTLTFEWGSGNSFTQAVEDTDLDSFDLYAYEKINDQDNGGRLYTAKIVVKGNGKDVLDSEVVTLDGDARYLSFNSALTPAEGTVYEVGNAADLAYMYYYPQNDYRLIANIDLMGTEWLPVGTASVPFKGTFEGTNDEEGYDYVISNFTMRQSIDSVGFFGVIDAQSVIQNVSILNADIIANGTNGRAGVLAAVNNGRVINVNTSGKVRSDFSEAGGIVGVNNSTIDLAFANVDVQGGTAAGGVAGVNNGTVRASASYNAVRAVTSSENFLYAGGLVGHNAGDIQSSFARGGVYANTAKASSILYAGGLVGLNDTGSKIENSYATGTVSASISFQSASGFAGGFAGENRGDIKDAYSYSNLNSGNALLGGFVAVNSGTTQNTFVFGKVIIGLSEENGIYAAKNSGTITNAYYNATISNKAMDAIKVDTGTSSVAAKEQTYMRSAEFAEELGASFHVNSSVSTLMPILSELVYLDSMNVSRSVIQNSRPSLGKAYFGGEEVPLLYEANTSSSGSYYVTYLYEKTDENGNVTATYKAVRYVTVR